MVFRFDAIGVELDRERNRSVEVSEYPLSPVCADPFREVNRFLARDTDRIFLGLDLEIVLVDTWQFNYRHDVVALLKYVDWRERAQAGGLVLQPVALYARFKRPLQIE